MSTMLEVTTARPTRDLDFFILLVESAAGII
jgi:hypothetical protein